MGNSKLNKIGKMRILMALFGLFKKKGRGATDTIDLTRMQSVRNKIAADSSASSTTSTDTSSSMGSMDLPMSMGTFDNQASTSSAPSYSAAPNEERTSGKISMLMMRVDLLEHKIDRLERKTGIKSEEVSI